MFVSACNVSTVAFDAIAFSFKSYWVEFQFLHSKILWCNLSESVLKTHLQHFLIFYAICGELIQNRLIEFKS